MLKRILISLTCICSAAFAAETPPSEASLKELLAVTESRKLIDSTLAQVDGMMKNIMAQASQGQVVTPEMQKILDKMKDRSVAIMKEELDWALFEPLYLKIYGQSFSQEEVDGMIAFYSSTAGKAVVKKMPVVMQNVMTEMQGRMRPLMMKMQAAQQEMMQEIQAARAKPQGLDLKLIPTPAK
jgi:uncharacterized protein